MMATSESYKDKTTGEKKEITEWHNIVLWRGLAANGETPAVFGIMRADLFDAVIKRLSMFVLRAKVKFRELPLQVSGVSVGASSSAPNDSSAPGDDVQTLAALAEAAGTVLPTQIWQRHSAPGGTWIQAPSAIGPRFWWISESTGDVAVEKALAAIATLGDTASWNYADLAAGLPWIGHVTQDVFIPQTVNLDLIQGVSFSKGCYPGQEVVARSHYRGTVKRRMAFGVITGESASPARHTSHEALAGVDIFDAREPDDPCGRVVDASTSAPVGLLFEIALAALPSGDLRLGAADGPVIRRVDLPYSIVAPAAA